MSSDGAPGLLLVLSAPSGAGKTTLAHRLRASLPDAAFSVSATTRPPRGAERDGIDYHFVTRERFDALVAQGAFAEWAEVFGQRYGTLRETADAALRGGRIALFDIDVQGGAQLRVAYPADAVTVFLVPPDVRELERRLRGRSTESDDVIARRLAAARAEVALGLASYDYVVVNDDLDAAQRRLEALVGHERVRRAGGSIRRPRRWRSAAGAERWTSAAGSRGRPDAPPAPSGRGGGRAERLDLLAFRAGSRLPGTPSRRSP